MPPTMGNPGIYSKLNPKFGTSFLVNMPYDPAKVICVRNHENHSSFQSFATLGKNPILSTTTLGILNHFIDIQTYRFILPEAKQIKMVCDVSHLC